MRTVAWDLSHCSTWVIRPEDAFALCPNAPEYCYYGHLDQILRESKIANTKVIESELNSYSLASVDAIVIPHCAHPDVESCYAGKPQFDEPEVQLIQRFVSEGGGLLVIGEYCPSRWRVNINDVLRPLGFEFEETQLAVLRGRNAHIMSRHFACTNIAQHEAGFGISAVSYHRGCSVRIIRSGVSLISAPSGETVVAVRRFGNGRIAAIGDSDLFALPFIGHSDNATLFTNLVQWVSGADIGDATQEAVRYKLRDLTGEIEGRAPFHRQIGNEGESVLLQQGFPSMPQAVSMNPYDPAHIDDFLDEARNWYEECPAEVRRAVRRFRREGNRSGAMLIRGLEIGKIPRTPADSRAPADREDYVPEFTLAAFGEAVGDTISYLQEKDGELFHSIAPTKHNERNLSSESSIDTLTHHTETAFHPFMPDYVLLFCLRSDHDRIAQTFTSSVRHILPLLSLRTRAILFEDRFRTGIDYSFGSASGTPANGPVSPVLFGQPYDPFMKFDLELMRGVDGEAQSALDELAELSQRTTQSTRLGPGDLMIIDNRRATHGRTRFKPRYDGRDRWLMRTYVVRDMFASEEERLRHQRILDTEFAL